MSSGVPLSRKQCLLLISAGSLSHFLTACLRSYSHIFHVQGEILTTCWWKTSALIYPDAVIDGNTEHLLTNIRPVLETCPDHGNSLLYLVPQINCYDQKKNHDHFTSSSTLCLSDSSSSSSCMQVDI